MLDVVALKFPLEQQGLKEFSRALAAGGIPHKIVENCGELCLMVASKNYVLPVEAAWHAWQNGVQWKVVENIAADQLELAENPPRVPLTITVLVLSIIGYSLVFLVQLRILPLEFFMALLWSPWPAILTEPWRIITPVFLHFSLLHVAFNSLWWWELGKSLERQIGTVNLLGLFILLALVSNFAQGLETVSGRFGGLSGVVYGLLGFNWLLARLSAKVRFDLPPAVMPIMIGWLVLCYTNIFSLIGLANIANEAHLAGLLGGLVFAVLFAAWQKTSHSIRT